MANNRNIVMKTVVFIFLVYRIGNASACTCTHTDVLVMYGNMVIPIYKRSGDPNELTRQSAYVRRPQGLHISTALLHIILPGNGPKLYVYICSIDNYAGVMVAMSTTIASKYHPGMHSLSDTSTVIGIFVLLPFLIRFDSTLLIQPNSVFSNIFDSHCTHFILIQVKKPD